MNMDPVVVLMEELRAAELVMNEACKKNAIDYSRTRAEAINELLGQVKTLNAEILDTPPSSPVGASILIRIVAGRMPFTYARYTTHLQLVADRLEKGQRRHTDLVWLRALAEGLATGPKAEPEAEAEAEKNAALGRLISRAVGGVARPVVVFRAVLPPVQRPPDWHALAQGPH